MKKLVFILCAALFTPVAARAQAVAGSCERNAAMAQTLSDNGGPYLAPICLGSPGSTDAPVDRATHAKNDVTRLTKCPPGVSGASCFQRRSEVLAYACENGAQPDVKAGTISKTPDGCEADRADKTGRAGNCKIFSVPAWRISCPAAPQPAVAAEPPTASPPSAVPPTVGGSAPVVAAPPTTSPSAVMLTPPIAPPPEVVVSPTDAGTVPQQPDAGVPGPAPDASAGTP